MQHAQYSSVPLADADAITDYDSASADLIDGLVTLRSLASAANFPLDVDGAAEASTLAHSVVRQLDDYLIPRLRNTEAPLLAVVGGSTGVGKSTLVNSLVGMKVSPAGVIRPTTRSPVLICHPDDMPWFSEPRVLGELPRSTPGDGVSDTGVEGTLWIVPSASLTSGIAVLDAPDIDSVVETNRALAHQLFSAADLWLFVVSATRYADAVPWTFLEKARERGTALAMVLDRVSAESEADITTHLQGMMRRRGIADPPLFVIPETALEDGLLPRQTIASLQIWLAGLAGALDQRDRIARHSVNGAVGALPAHIEEMASASEAQEAASTALRSALQTAFSEVTDATRDHLTTGKLFSGELLTRWQRFVDSNDLVRGLEGRTISLREKLSSAFAGKAPTAAQVKVALEAAVHQLVVSTLDNAVDQAIGAWRSLPGSESVVAEIESSQVTWSAESGAAVNALIEQWQQDVAELVRDRRNQPGASPQVDMATGLAVMVAAVAGAEVAFSPRYLDLDSRRVTVQATEDLFGPDGFSRLAETARASLIQRVQDLADEYETRQIEFVAIDKSIVELPARLRSAGLVVTAAHRRLTAAIAAIEEQRAAIAEAGMLDADEDKQESEGTVESDDTSRADDIEPENAEPDNAERDEPEPDNAELDNAERDEAEPENAGSAHAGPESAESDESVEEPSEPESGQPGGVAPKDRAADGVESDTAAPDIVEPENAAPDVPDESEDLVAPDDLVAAAEAAPDEAVPREAVPDVPDDVASADAEELESSKVDDDANEDASKEVKR